MINFTGKAGACSYTSERESPENDPGRHSVKKILEENIVLHQLSNWWKKKLGGWKIKVFSVENKCPYSNYQEKISEKENRKDLEQNQLYKLCHNYKTHPTESIYSPGGINNLPSSLGWK